MLTKPKDNLFFTPIVILILTIILFSGNVALFNTSKIVDIFCLVSFPFLDISGLMMVVAFLTPINSGITVLYIFGYIALLILAKDSKLNVKILLSVFALAIYELLFSASMPEFSGTSFFTYIIVFFLFVYGMNKPNMNYKRICFAYIAGVVLLLVTVFVTASQTHTLEAILSGGVRIGVHGEQDVLGGNIALMTDNANNLGYHSCTAIVMSILLLSKAKMSTKIALTIAITINVFIGAFTISRTWFLLTAIGVILVFLFGYHGVHRIILLISLGIVLVAIITLLGATNILDAFFARFDQISEDARTQLLQEYLGFLWQNPSRFLFGTGALYYKEVCMADEAIHTGSAQILVSYGLLGALFWLWLLLSPITSHLRTKKIEFRALIPLLVVIAFTQTIQFINPYMLMMPYMIAICFMKIPKAGESL